MTGFVDMHVHMIPGVDDGAKTMEEALGMLRMEYEDGVRSIILTPHFRYEMFETPLEKVKERFEELKEASERYLPEMRLYLGCELHASMDMTDCLKAGERLTMAGSRYVLVEFSTGDIRSYIRERTRGLIINGYIPIIAHAERYAALREDIEVVDELRSLGAYIQINADTISGKDGFGMKRFGKRLLKEGLVDFVGTDAHGTKKRVPGLKKAAVQIEKILGEEVAREILTENPRRILSNSL